MLSESFYHQWNYYIAKRAWMMVHHDMQIYGENEAVFNVHSLTHPSKILNELGALDTLPTFASETFICHMTNEEKGA